jgi:LuxR family maltose regulon positive regulatory protein
MAMASWAAGRSAAGPVAWVSLDRYASQPRVFWTYVVEAIRGAGLSVPGNVWAPVRGCGIYQGLGLRLAAAVSAHGAPVYLVLDDLHAVADHRTLETLDELIRNSRPALRVLAGARSDPLLPLHRYRLADELTELRADELAFRLTEARLLLAHHKVSLTARSLALLVSRIEGWAAPLRLSAISMQSRPDPDGFVREVAAEHSAVAAYLVTEVLNAQPREVRRMLLRSSILERVCAELADELAGEGGGRPSFPRLAEASACVEPLGNGWYRYHPLLAEVLSLKLRREYPGQVPALNRRAARWLHTHGYGAEAVRQAAQADDWPLAARIVVDELAVSQLMLPLPADSLVGPMTAMPRTGTWAEPHPWLVAAALEVAGGDHQAADTALSAADRILRRAPAGAELPGRLAAEALRMHIASGTGQYQAAIAAAERAEALAARLPADLRDRYPRPQAELLAGRAAAEMWAGQADRAASTLEAAAIAAGGGSLRARCLGQLALLEALRGRLRQAARLAATAADLPDASFPPGLCGCAATVALACVHLERNELGEARQELKRANSAMRVHPDAMAGAVAALLAARVLLAEGRAKAALDALDRLSRRRPEACWLERNRLLAEAEAWTAAGNHVAAVDAARHAGAGTALDASAAAAQALLAGGDVQAARQLLAGWPETFAEAPDHLLIEGWLAEARLARESGDQPAAARALGQALRVAAAEQVRRPFAVHREWIEPITAGSPDLARSYLRMVRPRAATGAAGPAAAANGKATLGARPLTVVRSDPVIVEELSGREREVLQCAAQLLDTTEIAEEMYISVNTVKSHFRSIFRKLAASSRNEAVRRARQFELLLAALADSWPAAGRLLTSGLVIRFTWLRQTGRLLLAAGTAGAGAFVLRTGLIGLPPGPLQAGLRSPEACHQPGDEGRQEDLADQRLEHGNGTAAAAAGGEVAIAEGGQRGEAEVLECLDRAGRAVGEEAVAAESVHGAIDGSEHQPDDHVRAHRAIDALQRDQVLDEYPPHDDHDGAEQEQGHPGVRGPDRRASPGDSHQDAHGNRAGQHPADRQPGLPAGQRELRRAHR